MPPPPASSFLAHALHRAFAAPCCARPSPPPHARSAEPASAPPPPPRLAQHYLKWKRLGEVSCRFDGLTVTVRDDGTTDLRHIRAAFDATGAICGPRAP